MDDLEFIDFTRTMMEKVCQHMTDSVEDVDAAEIQSDYSTPVKFAQSIIHDTIASEVLKATANICNQRKGNDSEM